MEASNRAVVTKNRVRDGPDQRQLVRFAPHRILRYVTISILIAGVGLMYLKVFVLSEASLRVLVHNDSSIGVGVYKILLNGEKLIYSGGQKRLGPGENPMRNGVYNFSAPPGQQRITIYYVEDNGGRFVSSCELDNRDGRCGFYARIDDGHTLDCKCDDLYYEFND